MSCHFRIRTKKRVPWWFWLGFPKNSLFWPKCCIRKNLPLIGMSDLGWARTSPFQAQQEAIVRLDNSLRRGDLWFRSVLLVAWPERAHWELRSPFSLSLPDGVRLRTAWWRDRDPPRVHQTFQVLWDHQWSGNSFESSFRDRAEDYLESSECDRLFLGN